MDAVFARSGYLAETAPQGIDEGETMDYQILEAVAPCGLSGKKCFAFADGEIKAHAGALSELLGSNFISIQNFLFILIKRLRTILHSGSYYRSSAKVLAQGAVAMPV